MAKLKAFLSKDNDQILKDLTLVTENSQKEVLSLSYTNRRVEEIEKKLDKLGASLDQTERLGIVIGPAMHKVEATTDSDGTVTERVYEPDSNDPGHFTVKTNVKDGEGRSVAASKEEYFKMADFNGKEHLVRMIITLDGDRTDTTYNAAGLPFVISHGGGDTVLHYDQNDRLIRKERPEDVTEIEYGPTITSKINHVRTKNRDGTVTEESWYTYDDSGGLTFAKTSAGKGVRLFYDDAHRIKSLMDQNRRVIRFGYNAQSRPVRIEDPQLGAVTVTYTDSGEIEKVDSTAGRAVAVQITGALQNLLDVIRPAGIKGPF